MRLTQSLRRSGRLCPDVAATICGGRRRTWAEVADRVARLAGALVALGLKPGDRVYAIAANSDHYLEYYYAVIWAGGIVVPGNTRWAGPEHDYAIADSGAAFLFVDGRFHPLIESLSAAVGLTVICMGMAAEAVGPGQHGMDALIAANAPIADRSGQDDALVGIFYTGGTTGRSKGVMLSHRSIAMSFLCGSLVRRLHPDPIFLHSSPMFHLADAAMLFGITNVGGTHAILPEFTAKAMVELIERERVTMITVVPTMFAMLDEYLAGANADLSSVTRVSYGAAPITVSLLKRAQHYFSAAEFLQSYGQTELSPTATMLEGRFHDLNGPFGDTKLRSAGQPIPFVEIEIRDEAGRALEPGEVGEICVNSPACMLGYWNQPELTAETIVEGWLKTGDAGYLDADGFLFVVDRVKDMIISGGENIYCGEVENAIASHPGVHEAAVIGIPDERWGERVHAVVRLKAGSAADAAGIIDHCRRLIAGYKCPRSVDFLAGPFPLSAAGKILKSELRKPFWDGQQRSVN